MRFEYHTCMALRLLMFTAFAILVGTYANIFFGSAIFAAAEEHVYSITLRDTYKNEVHELSGIIMTESTCHDASIRSQDIDDTTTAILLETWERPFSLGCEKAPTPRFVETKIFANERIHFRGMLNGEWVPLTIVKSE